MMSTTAQEEETEVSPRSAEAAAHVPRSAEDGATRKREGRAGEGGSDARRGGDSVHS